MQPHISQLRHHLPVPASFPSKRIGSADAGEYSYGAIFDTSGGRGTPFLTVQSRRKSRNT